MFHKNNRIWWCSRRFNQSLPYEILELFHINRNILNINKWSNRHLVQSPILIKKVLCISESECLVIEVYLKKTGYSTGSYKSKAMILTNKFWFAFSSSCYLKINNVLAFRHYLLILLYGLVTPAVYFVKQVIPVLLALVMISFWVSKGVVSRFWETKVWSITYLWEWQLGYFYMMVVLYFTIDEVKWYKWIILNWS